MLMHLRNPSSARAFGIGFCILFAFIGTFTYVNFVLVRAPLSLVDDGVGFVYFVFLPSIITTPIAGSVGARFGTQTTLLGFARRRRARPAARCSCRTFPPCSSAWRWSASAPSSRRRPRPASSAAPRRATAARRAASISPPTSSAGSSAAPCSARSSTASAGRPASPASASRSLVAAFLALFLKTPMMPEAIAHLEERI